MNRTQLTLQQPGIKGLIAAHPDEWNAVLKTLEELYEAYSRGRVSPRDLGYDDEVDMLMSVYDKWLDYSFSQGGESEE